MKKIVCLVLAIMMLASVAMMASAAVTEVPDTADRKWRAGTDVEYTCDGEEEWTLTVPALLAPGGAAGTVTLTGTWASDSTIVVTADATVTLTADGFVIDATRTLDVEFDGITQPGNNNAEITATADVSVVDFAQGQEPQFGDWSGTFNYTVTVNGNKVQ